MYVILILIICLKLWPSGSRSGLKWESKTNLALPISCFHIVRTTLLFVHPEMYSTAWEPVGTAPGKHGQSGTAEVLKVDLHV